MWGELLVHVLEGVSENIPWSVAVTFADGYPIEAPGIRESLQNKPEFFRLGARSRNDQWMGEEVSAGMVPLATDGPSYVKGCFAVQVRQDVIEYLGDIDGRGSDGGCAGGNEGSWKGCCIVGFGIGVSNGHC